MVMIPHDTVIVFNYDPVIDEFKYEDIMFKKYNTGYYSYEYYLKEHKIYCRYLYVRHKFFAHVTGTERLMCYEIDNCLNKNIIFECDFFNLYDNHYRKISPRIVVSNNIIIKIK